MPAPGVVLILTVVAIVLVLASELTFAVETWTRSEALTLSIDARVTCELRSFLVPWS